MDSVNPTRLFSYSLLAAALLIDDHGCKKQVGLHRYGDRNVCPRLNCCNLQRPLYSVRRLRRGINSVGLGPGQYSVSRSSISATAPRLLA